MTPERVQPHASESRQQRRQQQRLQRKQLVQQLRRADRLKPMSELGETALDYALHGAEAGDVIVHEDGHLALVAVVMHTDCLNHAASHLAEAALQIPKAAGE